MVFSIQKLEYNDTLGLIRARGEEYQSAEWIERRTDSNTAARRFFWVVGLWVWCGVVWLMKSVAFSMHCCARLIVHVQLVPYVDL